MGLYESKFKEITTKYGMEEANTKSDSSLINSIIIKLLQERCYGKTTALWGAGKNNSQNSHASVIVNKYATYIQNLKCIIDSSKGLQGKEFLGLPIIAPEDIAKNQIEIIIVASKVSGKSILADIKKYAPDCTYIDIYQELNDRGILIYHEFFREASMYTHLFDVKKQYEEEPEYEKKQYFLKQLISAYLSIRDIYYAVKYIDEYCGCGFSDKKNYMQLKKEILALTQEIASKNAKKQDDIIIYFIDSLRAMDVYEKRADGTTQFGMLKEYFNKSAYFTNIYSTGATTYESMISIISQQMPFEKNVYDNNLSFPFEGFDLLMEAKKREYQFQFYVPEEYKIIKENEHIVYHTHLYFTEKIWNVACDMAESDKKTFNFVYFPYELHFPLICGFHKKRPMPFNFSDVGIIDMSSFIEEQFEDCKKYVDTEMEYFRQYFNDDINTIIFSDHSQVVYDNKEQKPYFMYYNNLDRSTHAVLLAKGKHIKPREVSKMHSMIDFNKILMPMIDGEDIEETKKDIIQYQYYPIHNKQIREYAKENGYTDYIDGMNCFASLTHIYIVTGNGKEEVFKKTDIRHNIIHSDEGAAFAEKVKAQYSTEFPAFMKIHRS